MTTGIGIRIRVEGAPEASAQLGQVDASVRRVGASAGQSTTGTDRLAQSFGRLRQQAVGLVGAIGAGVLAREFIAQADAMTLLDARLRNAVGTGKAFTQAQRDIFEIAQANNVGLRETAQLYTRLAAPVQRLGGTVREVSGITDAFALALRVGGASAQEAASATLQFAQAMGSGRLQGDEFRSMAEASPRFLQALADGMGQPIEKLKEMGAEGKLTADVVGNALLKALGQLREEAQALPDTVGGALTRLQNEALLAVVAFNEMTGAAGLVAETVGMGAEWIVRMTGAVRVLDADTRGLSGTVDLAAVGFGALGTILETVVLIGSDVAFVLKGIGREIGGIAAQAAAVLRGDFEAAAAIRREMISDAEQARAALDKFQSSVRGATSGILAQRSALRENSLSAAENSNELARLSKHAGAADTAFRKLRSSVADDAKESKEAAKAKAKAAKDLADTLRDYESVRAKELEANAKSIEGLDKELQGLRDRYVETTAGKQVLDDLVNVRIEDAAATHEQMAAMMALAGENELAIAQQRVMAEKLREQISLRKAIATAVAGKEADEANARAAQAAATDWQRTADQIGQSLSDALMQGGKSASEYIAGLFRTMVLRPIIQAIVSPVAGAVAGAMGFAGPAQAAGGGIGSLGSIGSAIGAFGGSFGTGMAYGGASGLVGGLSGAGALLGAGNVGMGLGAAAGALGPYALAAMAAYSLFKHKPTHHMGSVVGVDAAGAANSLWGDPSRIMDHYSGETDAALRGLGVSAAGVLNQLSGVAGGTGGYSALLKFAADNNDPSIGGLNISRAGQTVSDFGVYQGDFRQYASDSGAGFSSYARDVAAATRAALDELDLPGWARDQLAALAPDADMAELASVAQAIADSAQSLEDAAASTSAAVEAERAGLQRQLMELQGDTVGLRELERNALDESNRALYDKIQALRDEQAAAATAAEAEARATETARAVAGERYGLETQLLQLQGDTAALRARELAALDPSNRAIMERIFALQDEQAASAAATQTAAEAAAAAAEAAQAMQTMTAAADGARFALLDATDAEALRYTRIREQLADLGIDVSMDQLLSATKAEILAFAESFGSLGDVSVEAKTAVWNLASSLGGLKQSVSEVSATAVQVRADMSAPSASAITASAEAMLWQERIAGTVAKIKAGGYGDAFLRDMERSVSIYGPERESGFATLALIGEEKRRMQMSASQPWHFSGRDNASMAAEQRDLAQEQIDSTQDLIDAMNGMSASLREMIEDLMGSALDPRNPAEKYASEKAQIESLARQAMAGDMAAAERFKGGVGGFLDLSQGYNASTAAYAADFARMISLLEQVAASMDRQGSVAESTLTVQQRGFAVVAANTGETARTNDAMARTSSVEYQRTIE